MSISLTIQEQIDILEIRLRKVNGNASLANSAALLALSKAMEQLSKLKEIRAFEGRPPPTEIPSNG